MGMYSCKKATEMVEKKSVVGLSFSENLKLKLHLSICKACKTYQKQSELIDSFIVDKTKQEENIPEIENNDLKSSIISKLNQW
tara:strand:+ start:1639 stop:1887 length:249 start_codon:yes stop_codon:yes gene_type:complete